MAHLPAGLPVPRLLDVYDDGEWVALMYEEVDGRHPAVLWRSDELERVAVALAHLGAALRPLADFQPQERVRMMIDPDGHPFCLFLRG